VLTNTADVEEVRVGSSYGEGFRIKGLEFKSSGFLGFRVIGFRVPF
jgi:hypothetical protein